MSRPDRTIVYEGGLFRVEHQPVKDRTDPYVFVRRVGAVTALPIIKDASGEPFVLTIDNNRRYYGMLALSLPSGNVNGGHDNPDTPADTALRELIEETGYGYSDPSQQSMDTFTLRTVSNTIDYPRFLVVARSVEYIGGEDHNPAEVIALRPTPVGEYLDELLNLRNGRTYPEVNAAFAKAGMECGREAVMAWLVGDKSAPNAAAVPQSFEPWLLHTHS
ncbi:MAG TPA: NUDIX domain-containing protein [Candidatus Saccharimonadales bacterium]|nr:NUDIX domain-containing protein [Candidatus Saccharimonadales bacterium]